MFASLTLLPQVFLHANLTETSGSDRPPAYVTGQANVAFYSKRLNHRLDDALEGFNTSLSKCDSLLVY